MLTKETSIVSLAGALVICAILASSGVDAYKAMTEKTKAQVAALEAQREWKRQFTQLIPVDERWNASLGLFSDATDLLTIHGLVSVQAPHSDPDTLLVGKIERVVSDGRDLGAQKVCVTSGGTGWTLTGATFSELLKGMQSLVARVDMELGSMTLTQDKGKAKATLSTACLLLRDSGPRAQSGAPLTSPPATAAMPAPRTLELTK